MLIYELEKTPFTFKSDKTATTQVKKTVQWLPAVLVFLRRSDCQRLYRFTIYGSLRP